MSASWRPAADGALSGSALFPCEHGRRRPRWRSYLLRLSLSPTEEIGEGAEYRRSWLWDAVRRPLRCYASTARRLSTPMSGKSPQQRASIRERFPKAKNPASDPR